MRAGPRYPDSVGRRRALDSAQPMGRLRPVCLLNRMGKDGGLELSDAASLSFAQCSRAAYFTALVDCVNTTTAVALKTIYLHRTPVVVRRRPRAARPSARPRYSKRYLLRLEGDKLRRRAKRAAQMRDCCSVVID